MLPLQYSKNSHSEQEVSTENGSYQYRYTFKDHKNIFRTWSWNYDKKAVDDIVNAYGVPPEIFKPYRATADVISKRKRQIRDGMYKIRGRCVIPDNCAVAAASMKPMRPLYELLDKVSVEEKLSKRDRIELLMKFCQDIPYGIPPESYNGKVISGLYPPPLVLKEKYGDCDTKAVMFVSILSYDPYYKTAFLKVPRHVLLGIEGIPQPYDKHITYNGIQYIFCEPVGPGRYPFGEPGSPYREISIVEPFIIEEETRNLAVEDQSQFSLDDGGKGNVFVMRIIIDNEIIINKKLKMMVNTTGFSDTFYELQGMPDDKGLYSYGTPDDKIFVWVKGPGLHICIVLGMPEGERRYKLDFNMDRGRCFYIKTNPKGSVNVFKKKNDSSYFGYKYSADKEGIIRLICEPGEYDVAEGATLSGELFTFDYIQGLSAFVQR